MCHSNDRAILLRISHAERSASFRSIQLFSLTSRYYIVAQIYFYIFFIILCVYLI